jgi:hypothetical protein
MVIPVNNPQKKAQHFLLYCSSHMTLMMPAIMPMTASIEAWTEATMVAISAVVVDDEVAELMVPWLP